MDIGAVLFGLALLAISLPFVASPFLARTRSDRPEKLVKSPDERKLVFSALHDLDFDYQLGKVNDVDYAVLRSALLGRAADLVQASEEQDAEIEALVQARRQALAKTEHCPHCGTKLHAGDLFCSTCGSSLDESKNRKPAEPFHA